MIKGRKEAGEDRSSKGSVTASGMLCLIITFMLCNSAALLAGEWYVSSGSNASDANSGTKESPFRSIRKALSVTKPGDVVIISAGTYPCVEEILPDGREGFPVTVRSAGDGKVILSGDGTKNLLSAGSYNIITGIEFLMTSEKNLEGFGIYIFHKNHIDISSCRFYACDVGVKIFSSNHISITNCEMAFSGKYGVHMIGSGDGSNGHWDPSDTNAWIEVRNCWMHDAGWNVGGYEGYGITSNGAVENLVIENCQIDNNTGDGILYEDWGIHTTARYNVIRGTGIAGIWIDNASMSIFDNNFLFGNNVGIWLSGEEDYANRYQNDMISMRNNIIVHNDWAAISPTIGPGKNTILVSQITRDVYFENNTVAYNKSSNVISIQRRPPLARFSNFWFRNNIFWGNSGPVSIASGLDTSGIHFQNNLWDKPYQGDKRARTGDPAFVDPAASSPEGYRLKSSSAAIDAGMLLYENPLDFWNGQRPHLPKAGTTKEPNPKTGFYVLPKEGKYDIGAVEAGTNGKAHIGLDLSKFPFEVTPFKLQFKAKPQR